MTPTELETESAKMRECVTMAGLVLLPFHEKLTAMVEEDAPYADFAFADVEDIFTSRGIFLTDTQTSETMQSLGLLISRHSGGVSWCMMWEFAHTLHHIIHDEEEEPTQH